MITMPNVSQCHLRISLNISNSINQLYLIYISYQFIIIYGCESLNQFTNHCFLSIQFKNWFLSIQFNQYTEFSDRAKSHSQEKEE